VWQTVSDEHIHIRVLAATVLRMAAAAVAGLRRLDCHRVLAGQVYCMLAGRIAAVLVAGRTAAVLVAGRTQQAGRRGTVKGVVREGFAMGTVTLLRKDSGDVEDVKSSGMEDCCRPDRPGRENSRETWRATGEGRDSGRGPNTQQTVVGATNI
jgi:hypothetical protein